MLSFESISFLFSVKTIELLYMPFLKQHLRNVIGLRIVIKNDYQKGLITRLLKAFMYYSNNFKLNLFHFLNPLSIFKTV